MTLSGWLFLTTFSDLFRSAVDRNNSTDTSDTVDLPALGKVRVAKSLNFLGDTCLRTNLLTKRALAYSDNGDVIEIITDNPSSSETIPFMSPNYNSTHLVTIHNEQCWKIYLRKGKA